MRSIADDVVRKCFLKSCKNRERNYERSRAERYTSDRYPRNERDESSPRLRRVILARAKVTVCYVKWVFDRVEELTTKTRSHQVHQEFLGVLCAFVTWW